MVSLGHELLGSGLEATVLSLFCLPDFMVYSNVYKLLLPGFSCVMDYIFLKAMKNMALLLFKNSFSGIYSQRLEKNQQTV